MTALSVALVGLGGAVGAVLRYLLSLHIPSTEKGFPVATVLINLLGSCLIVLVHQAADGGSLSPSGRLLLATGVLGGFTTYSSFNYETLRLLITGHYAVAALNVIATFAGCLLGAWLIQALIRPAG